MVRFSGEKQYALSPAALWAHLTDTAFLMTCLPDLEKIDRRDATTAAFVLRPGFAFVRGTLNAEMTIVEAVAPNLARYRLDARGIGSNSTVEVTLTLKPSDTGCTLNYEAQVTHLGGLLKLVPSGLISGAARKVVSDVLLAVERNLPAGD